VASFALSCSALFTRARRAFHDLLAA
jgi:hypothetical protein